MKKWSYYLLLLLCVITLFVGCSPTVNALTISSNYMGYAVGENFSVGSGNYIQKNSSLVVDAGSSGNYLAVDLCSTTGSDFTISNISNQSGSVSLYKVYNLGSSCSTGSYAGELVRIFYTINSWSDAGNGNFGLIFTSRFTNNVSWNGIYVVKAINILDSLNLDDALLDNIDNINSNITNVQNNINNSINNSTNQITGSISETEDNINQNIDDMEQSIVDSNKETQDVIKDQFNDCRDSYNLINVPETYILTGYQDFNISLAAGTYTISAENIQTTGIHQLILISENGTQVLVFGLSSTSLSRTFTINQSIDTIRIYSADTYANSQNITTTFRKLMLNEGATAKEYEEYGKQICKNKLDEANETSKGIWETIKNLPNAFLDMLKGFFIPNQEELQELIDNFKETMAEKLGAIYQVADVLIDVFNSILEPSSKNSCLTFPEIKDPYFDKMIVEETDFCFDSLRTYFDFLFSLSDMIISIVCTLAFANMLYRKYEGFIGGDSGDY